MGAHTMFRQIAEIVAVDTEEMLDKKLDPDWYAMRLGHFGNALVRNLHGHHTWEDRKFFPELMAADDRFIDGLEMLVQQGAASLRLWSGSDDIPLDIMRQAAENALST
ncbi:MAG: hemerythrin domain-containing protein [Pseudomonadota bacterium]|nr:hemerythrin domain-containing protein [Pseudomonadota bacterium]